MIRADLHVHSTFSKRPSEWFLQRIGTQESYTAVEDIYRIAKRRGMTYVTVTDHNTIDGALRLKEMHPEDTFVSVEATSYFPETGCKIHVLAYDVTEPQFEAIQTLRESIYDLRDYLHAENIACSVAHATYSVNARLDADTIEKLILLFDVFEGTNGARNAASNERWTRTLRSLTPEHIERLRDKHGIVPWSPNPWSKGFTGGSDDHGGIFIGATYTVAHETTLPAFIDRIRGRQTIAAGTHGSHKKMAFTVYKVAYDFSKARAGDSRNGIWNLVNAIVFENRRLGLRNWLAVQRMKLCRDSRRQLLVRFFEDILNNRIGDGLDSDGQIRAIFDSMCNLADEFFGIFVRSAERDLIGGAPTQLVRNLSSLLPMAFLSAPIFTTMRHMHGSRTVQESIDRALRVAPESGDKKVLWFTDTLTDLNGVAVTMRGLAKCAHETRRSLRLVTTLSDAEWDSSLPPTVLNLPCIYTLTPEFYTSFTLRVPSLLGSLDRIAEENPDEIVVSTPGPVGVVGVLAARLLDVKCTGVYHTDFTRQADHFIGDETVSNVIEAYTRNFYRLLDEVRVPTQQYISMLSERGIDPSRMKVFRRGIDPSFVRYDENRQAAAKERLGLRDGVTLLWAGRAGKEKNLDLLRCVYEEVLHNRPNVNLVIAGDGPELPALKAWAADLPRVIFAGRVEREDLADFYFLSDLFVFPSTTDTFGMVVLEAQACGLPAIVTNVGGPQEIVRDGETGFVLSPQDRAAWVRTILRMVDMVETNPQQYFRMRQCTRGLFAAKRGWESVLDEFLLHESREEPTTPAAPVRRTPSLEPVTTS